jgi:hypothetical protein
MLLQAEPEDEEELTSSAALTTIRCGPASLAGTVRGRWKRVTIISRYE